LVFNHLLNGIKIIITKRTKMNISNKNNINLNYTDLIKIFSSLRNISIILIFSIILSGLYAYLQISKPESYKIKAQLTSLNELDFFKYKEFQYDMGKLYKDMENILGLSSSAFGFQFRKESLFDFFFSETFNKKNSINAAKKTLNENFNDNLYNYLINLEKTIEVDTVGSVIDTYNILRIEAITIYPDITRKYLENYTSLLNTSAQKKMSIFISNIINNYNSFYLNKIENLKLMQSDILKELNSIALQKGYTSYSILLDEIQKIKGVSFILENNNVNFGESNLDNNYIKFNIENLDPDIGLLLYTYSSLIRIEQLIKNVNLFYLTSNNITNKMENDFSSEINLVADANDVAIITTKIDKKYMINSFLVFISTFLTLTLIIYIWEKVKKNYNEK
tara:strand:- start:211 stop:1389 length:1179 start_codon:yes stop_codon:yes gene_type:complete